MGPTRPRPPTRWGPLRLLAAYGLGAVLISVPVNALGSGGPVGLSDRSLVALVSGVGQGFALDRDGEVLRIGADGSVQPTTSLGHHSTPFGTSVAGRAVFGGTRCDGPGCEQRVGEVAVLDSTGRVDSTVVVALSSGWPSRLDGLALVGTDGDTVWVNGGGQLHQVAVGTAAGGGPAQVVDEVTWPGGEPCVVAGRLYDLAPSGGITGQQGAWLGAGPGAAAPRFRLRLRRWTGDRWSSIPGGTTSMPNGQNAYCTSTGYEIRDATGPHAEWTPTAGAWHPPDPVAAAATATGSTVTGNPVTEATGTTGTARPATGTAATVAASPAGRAEPGEAAVSAAGGATRRAAALAPSAAGETGPTGLAARSEHPAAAGATAEPASAQGGAPEELAGNGVATPVRPALGVSVSSRGRYLVTASGGLVAVGGDGADRVTGVRIPGFAASDMPPAVLVDDSGGGLLWCATTYRSGAGSTRCGLRPSPAPTTPGTRSLAVGSAVVPTSEAWAPGQAMAAGGPAPSATVAATSVAASPGQAKEAGGSAAASGATDAGGSGLAVRAATGAGGVPRTGAGAIGGAGVVDHYNLCSAACGAGVRGHSRDVVAWAVKRDRPVALSLNEACYDDGVQLGGRLAGLVGGAGYSALDTAVGCPGAIKRFGNLVLVGGGLAPRGAAWGQFRTQADGPCDHRTDECRGMVCVDAGPVGQRRAFCSAHLESPRRAPGVAVDQAREYLAMVDARFGDHRARVLAGDFNLGRSDTDDVLGSAGYRAAAAGPSVGPRPSGGPEIDRIYDDGAHSAEVVGATYCDRQASDHCYLTTASAVLADPGRAV